MKYILYYISHFLVTVALRDQKIKLGLNFCVKSDIGFVFPRSKLFGYEMCLQTPVDKEINLQIQSFYTV
jgi:hypothetical protein